MRWTVPSLALLAGLAAPSGARAAGFYIGDVGARGLARGGALVAAPDSPLALHYNPAGLSLAKGLQLELSVAIVGYEASFERRCPCVDPSLDGAEALDAALEQSFRGNVARTSTPLTIPFIGVSYGFEPLGFAVGFGVYGPTSGRHDYGLLGSAASPTFVERARDKVTRYNALEAPNIEVNYVLGLSLEPLEGLRVGAGLTLHQTGASQTLHLFADTAFASGPEDPRWDVPLVLDFSSDPTFTWSAGLSYDIPFVPGLTVGGSLRAARSVRADGTILVDLPAELREIARVDGEEVVVSLNTAPIARFGVQWRLPEVLVAEAAFVWEGWGVNDRIVIEPQDISFEIEGLDPVVLGEIVSERNWRDTWSLRLGGELELLEPWLGVQAGWFYEPTAIPAEWLDPSRIDLDKHGIALGLSTEWYGVTLLGSFTYVVMDGTTVTDSRAQNTAPLGFAPELQTTVGNGRYEGEYAIGAVSLQFELDAFMDATR
jgi:long-subunit fatty acid transport protein